jgi:hypothetical protein
VYGTHSMCSVVCSSSVIITVQDDLEISLLVLCNQRRRQWYIAIQIVIASYSPKLLSYIH